MPVPRQDFYTLIGIDSLPLLYDVGIIPLWWLAGWFAGQLAPEYTNRYIVYAFCVFGLETMGLIYAYQQGWFSGWFSLLH